MTTKGVPRNEELEKLLAARFGVTDLPEDAPPLLEKADHLELARELRRRGYSIYVTVVATHYLAQEESKNSAAVPEHYEVVTVLRKPEKGAPAAVWRVWVGMDENIDSLAHLYAGADWQEREQYDLLGVEFAGHPDLRRLMMPEDWDGHPLRKDYAIETACSPWR